MAKIIGTEGDDDNLTGTAGPDKIFGLGGNDQINGDAGADLLDGGDGDDYITGSGDLRGGKGNDTLNGGVLDDLMHGGAGNDSLYGGGGKDTLYGDSGDDVLQVSAGGDVLYGGGGIDTLSISYLDVSQSVHYSFKADVNGAFHARYGTLAYQVEQVSITGGTGDDGLTGGGGNDTLRGWQGNDSLFGAEGDDYLIGDNGNDYMLGGAGNDLLYGGGHDDTLIGGDGNDTLIGGKFFDLYSGHDLEEGGRGADSFYGGNGMTDITFVHSEAGVYVDLELHRGFGGDAQGDYYDVTVRGAVIGSTYDDMIVSGYFQDGGAGNDRLVVIGGTFTTTGGDGADTFAFRYASQVDYQQVNITDFSQAQGDTIDLSIADARPAAGRQAYHFIGTAEFSGAPGEVRYENTDDGHTLVELQSDRDTLAEATIVLNGVFTLTTADFHF